MSLTIVNSNELVEAAYSLNLDEMRLLFLAMSKIDSLKSELKEIEILPSEFVRLFNVDSKNVYRSLRVAVKGIGRKPLVLPVADSSRVRELFWLSSNEYDNADYGTAIKMTFNPELAPYLVDIKQNFTSIKFEEAAKLTSPFSYRLYQWFNEAKNLNSSKENGTIKVSLDLEWMKKQSGLEGKYERWDVFKAKVINPAVEQINAKTDISVIWKPVKNGRKVDAIQFNYVLEKDELCMKPLRPRLFRRPKVLKGSHEEGLWMRKNLALLLEYEVLLNKYDCKAKLALSDLRKIADYASICDKITEDRVRNEIELRTTK